MAASVIIGNLAMYLAEDKIFQDTIYQADGVTLQDITGWSLTFTVYAYHDSGTAFITKTVGSGITLTNPTQGVLQVLISSADTLGMVPDQYEYRFERTNTGGDTVPTTGLFTLLSGQPSQALLGGGSGGPSGGGLTGTFP